MVYRNADYRWGRARRLRGRTEIKALFRSARRVDAAWLRCWIKPRSVEHGPGKAHAYPSRFVVAARKSVGSAPQRNRLKRLLREALRRHPELALVGGQQRSCGESRPAPAGKSAARGKTTPAQQPATAQHGILRILPASTTVPMGYDVYLLAAKPPTGPCSQAEADRLVKQVLGQPAGLRR